LNNKLKITLISLLTVALTGCVSEQFIYHVIPLKTGLSNYEYAVVTVEPELDDTIRKLRGYTRVKEELENSFISDLKKTNKFKGVYRPGEVEASNRALAIKLIILHYIYLPVGASSTGSALPGNSYVQVLARLVDERSGEVIGESLSGTATRKDAEAFKASTDTLLSNVSEALSSDISAHK
jgi:hypothetical protein